MKKSLSVSTILFVILFNLSAFSQEKAEMPFNLGLYGGAGLNMHNPAFNDNINVLVPFPFNTGSNTLSPVAGIIANFPINHTFTISGRIGYYNLNGTVEGTEGLNNNVIDASLHHLEISPILQLHNLLPVEPLYFLAGLEVGVPLGTTYKHTVNNVTDNKTYELTDPALRFALAIGAGYTFKFGENTYLSPEVSYRLPFTQVSSNSNYDSWKVPQVRFGVNLTFGIGKQKDKMVDKPDNRYFEIGEPELTYYDEKMNNKPLDRIKVEEVQYTELYPFIPYVFFTENKAIPETSTSVLAAQNEAGEFSLTSLPQDGQKINTYTLDIIGKRLKDARTQDITVTGTTDSKEAKLNKNLSKERAEFCKNYLVANYGADPSKITIIAGNMPSNPSSKIDPDGEAENRRAEFSGNPDLLKPIVISGDLERVTSPQIVDFHVKYTTNDTVASYTLKYYQSGNLITQIDGKEMPNNISWQIGANQLLAKQIPVDWEFTTTSQSGLSKTINGSIPVDYFSFSRKKSENLPDKVISKFSLVLFDFDSPTVSDQDKRIIEKNVIPAISANSTVQIYGYTDRIGDADYNKKLAIQRAENVRKFLESNVKNVKFETYGIGESVQIFNNNTTIGRQLSRTVQIYIVTPKI